MRVFLAPLCEQVPVLPFVSGIHAERLFQNIPKAAFEGVIDFVDTVDAAEYVLMPHEYAYVRANAAYLAMLQKRFSKPVLIFSFGDTTEPIVFSNARIFRTSAYKSQLLPCEQVIPPMVEDLGALHGFESLPLSGKPRIGFVGFSGFARGFDFGKYLVRNYILRSGPQRQGLYFRRKCMAHLRSDDRFETDFIVRNSFSANKKTISLDPVQARKEYVENIKRNHFTLCPRGDGNFSLRFYEVLSLGRIPILIDTDVALPLEDTINYDEFVVRVPWGEVGNVGEYVNKFMLTAGRDGLQSTMKEARKTFIELLHFPNLLRQS